MEELRFPGALSLTEELDQMVLLMLRDGKHIVGRLACLDQFSKSECEQLGGYFASFLNPIVCVLLANIVLEEAAEWIIYKGMLAVQPVGLYIVRSDNIVIVSSFVRRPCSCCVYAYLWLGRMR